MMNILYLAALWLLSAIYNHADYLYQASSAGRSWGTWLPLDRDGRTWWFLRFDAWHRVQNVRNWLWSITAALCGVYWLSYGPQFAPEWLAGGLGAPVLALVVHGAGRAVGFTLVKLYYTGKW